MKFRIALGILIMLSSIGLSAEKDFGTCPLSTNYADEFQATASHDGEDTKQAVPDSRRVRIHPTTATDLINIYLPVEGESRFVLISPSGEIVLDGQMNQMNYKINLKNLVAGRYMIQIQRGHVIQQKMISVIR